MLKINPFVSFITMTFFLLCLIAFPGCVSAPSQGGAGTTSLRAGSTPAPEWVRDPYTKYSRQSTVAAVGMGTTRESAEKNALGNLVNIFGQSIQVDQKVSESYDQALRSGTIANWSENTQVNNTIITSSNMDTLVGAEIGDTWYDGRSEYSAVAILNKAKAAEVYTEMIQSNLAMIDNLTNMTPAVKNSFDGLVRYQFAAMIADINTSYGNLLSVIGAPVQGLKSGADYRLEVNNIIKAIPVNLRVQNDRSGRIQGAFAKALSDLGFQSGGTNSRYTLNVNIVTTPVTIANNQNKWTRIEVKADLTDANQRTVLLPFNFDSREGHTSQEEADNRAYAVAERRVNEEYAALVNDYLSQLMPKR